MAVPERETFEAWLRQAAQPFFTADELADTNHPINQTSLIACHVELMTRRQARLQELYSLPVIGWLMAQRAFERAETLVFSRRRRPLRHDDRSIQQIAEERAESALAAGPRGNRTAEDVAHEHLEFQARSSFKYGWLFRCVRALHEYHYGNASSRLASAARAIGPAADAVKRALCEYLAHADALNALDIPEAEIRGGYRTLHRIAGAGPPRPNVALLPIRRDDEHAPERLFVYRMHWANTSATGTSKVEAIAELMGMEGFRHQYDMRTIEKNCSAFTGNRISFRGK
jgi:hypothetical protein